MSLSIKQRATLIAVSHKRTPPLGTDMRKAAYAAPSIYGIKPNDTFLRQVWREVKSIFKMDWLHAGSPAYATSST